jgi:hypothetical protein
VHHDSMTSASIRPVAGVLSVAGGGVVGLRL